MLCNFERYKNMRDETGWFSRNDASRRRQTRDGQKPSLLFLTFIFGNEGVLVFALRSKIAVDIPGAKNRTRR